MKKFFAYSLTLLFVGALAAPVASFAEEEWPKNPGQRAAEGADPKEDASESSSAVATGIQCEACESHATAGNINQLARKQFKKGSSSGSSNSSESSAVEGDR